VRQGCQFRKGRAKTGGRRRGTPNRATRAVKEFLSEILDRADVQDAIRERILTGDTTAFFKAIEIVHGRPTPHVKRLLVNVVNGGRSPRSGPCVLGLRRQVASPHLGWV
jgi:hypothetical protein